MGLLVGDSHHGHTQRVGAQWGLTVEERGLSFSCSTLDRQLLAGFAVMSLHSTRFFGLRSSP